MTLTATAVVFAPVVMFGAVAGMGSTASAQCQPAGLAGQPVGLPAGSYVNPFTAGQWLPARTDQGVDWLPVVASPVLAIGNGVITFSVASGTGWPGGAFIAYQFTEGPAAGHFVYVAEHLANLLPAGTTVAAGQQIATAVPGYPWTEWGWAAPTGPSPAVPYNGLPDGTATSGGQAFARFLITLGARPLEDPGPGPIFPEGGPSAPTDVAGAGSSCIVDGSGIVDPTEFANALLAGLAITPNSGNVSALIAWEHAEGGWPINNPLNTTLGEPGATLLPGNPAHVKVYPTMAIGLQATLSTIVEPAYGAVVAALTGNDPYAVARAVAASPWGTPDFSNLIGLPYNPPPNPTLQ